MHKPLGAEAGGFRNFAYLRTENQVLPTYWQLEQVIYAFCPHNL